MCISCGLKRRDFDPTSNAAIRNGNNPARRAFQREHEGAGCLYSVSAKSEHHKYVR